MGITQSSRPNVVMLWEKHADLNASSRRPFFQDGDLYFFRSLFDNSEVSHLTLLCSYNAFTGNPNWRYPMEIYDSACKIFMNKDQILVFYHSNSSRWLFCYVNKHESYRYPSVVECWNINLLDKSKESSCFAAQTFEDKVYFFNYDELLCVEMTKGKVISKKSVKDGSKILLVNESKILYQSDLGDLVSLDTTTFEETQRIDRELLGKIRRVDLINNDLIALCYKECKDKCEDRLVVCDLLTGKSNLLLSRCTIDDSYVIINKKIFFSSKQKCLKESFLVQCYDLRTGEIKWDLDDPKADDMVIPSSNSTSVIIKSLTEELKEDYVYVRRQKICKIDNVSGKILWEQAMSDNSLFNKVYLDENRLYWQDDDFIKCYLLLGL
jgi:outer membrane protein assembly factor BamB